MQRFNYQCFVFRFFQHRPSQWKSLCLNCTKPSKGQQRDDKKKSVEMNDDGIPNDGGNLPEH